MGFPAEISPCISTGRKTSYSYSGMLRICSTCLMLLPCRVQTWFCVFAVEEGSPRPREKNCAFGCWLSSAVSPLMLGRLQLHRSCILGDAYATPEPTPSMVARADLRRFQAAIWCSDPDLIPNEAIIRIPEHVDSLGDNNLFLRPDQIIHHDLPMLLYKIEIEILEIHDWNDSSSSDDSGNLPDCVLSDYDDEDDYPGFHQASRSHPRPRQPVFRTPGYGSGSAAAGGSGEGPSSDAPTAGLALG